MQNSLSPLCRTLYALHDNSQTFKKHINFTDAWGQANVNEATPGLPSKWFNYFCATVSQLICIMHKQLERSYICSVWHLICQFLRSDSSKISIQKTCCSRSDKNHRRATCSFSWKPCNHFRKLCIPNQCDSIAFGERSLTRERPAQHKSITEGYLT